jgi:hypothetical protein
MGIKGAVSLNSIFFFLIRGTPVLFYPKGVGKTSRANEKI